MVFDGKSSVEAVVDDVHSRKRKLCAYLMGDSSINRNLKKRALLVLDEHSINRFEMRYCMKWTRFGLFGLTKAIVAVVYHFAEGERWIVDEVVFKRASHGNCAFHECQVCLLDALLSELRTECFKRLCASCNKNQSRSIGINAMKSSCHKGPVPKRDAFWVARCNSIHKSFRFAAGERLYGKGARFIEGENMIVLED